MSSPIIVNGSTTIISVRAKDFTYDSGATAIVILSSINNLNQMVTKFDEDGYVEKATYHFLDWFDGARRKINEDSHMFRYVQFIAEGYTQ